MTVNLNLCLGQAQYIFHYRFAVVDVFNYPVILVMLLLCNSAYVRYECYECGLLPVPRSVPLSVPLCVLFIFDTQL